MLIDEPSPPAAVEPRARSVALLDECRLKARLYGAKEIAFLRDIAARGDGVRLSSAQMRWLEALAAREPIDWAALAAAGLAALPALCRRWLPEVAQLRHVLFGTYGQELKFGTATAARDALNAANDKLRRPLLQLEDDELAA